MSKKKTEDVKSAGDKLTVQQKAFCEQYIILGNGTKAYQAVNPNPVKETCRTQASRWLKMPKIRAYIDELLEEKNSLLIAEQDEVLETLTQIMRNKNVKDSDRLRAAELLGKRSGLFKEKIETEHTGNIEINIGD